MTAEEKEHDLGRRIRRLREDMGLTVTELAERVGVTKGYISQIESGAVKKVAASHLFDIAQVLNTDIGYLLGRKVVLEQADTLVTQELKELQAAYDVNPEDIKMLASIEFRGERPKTVDGWKFILEALRHGRKI
ncbi:MAG: helix-turn-helix domain-containing protein [Candidatus Desulforudis sp.]|nr:helix-turn-helix domain-containing protein [Desulforudis sp.]